MSKAVDIMKGEPYFCPPQPEGGAEDMVWSPDSKTIAYVTKKKTGKEYATSTNSDIYFYDLASATTSDFTEDNTGYDTYPVFSHDGSRIAWLSMARDGYEADKNRIMVYDFKTKTKIELTKDWDESAGSLKWGKDNSTLYFIGPYQGTDVLYELTFPGTLSEKSSKHFRQLTWGDHDVTAMLGFSGDDMVVTRTDMNHASEVFKVNLNYQHKGDAKNFTKNLPVDGEYTQLTFTNKAALRRY